MEKRYCRQHAKYIAQTNHRISYTERIMLDDVHPKHRAGSKESTTTSELPVYEQMPPEILRPSERVHLLQSELQKHLSYSQECTLDDSQYYYSPHDNTMATEWTKGSGFSPLFSNRVLNKGVLSSWHPTNTFFTFPLLKSNSASRIAHSKEWLSWV